jgi:chorismate dehydratase
VPVVGVVPYLNAVPLADGLPPEVRRVEAVPSELAARLRAGALDAALLPVAEHLQGAGGARLGSFGIASEGPVETVLLFVPDEDPARWPDRVVVDPASRTSVNLLRCLLEDRYGLRGFRFEKAPAPGPDPAARTDAMTLVIGDAAFAHRGRWRGPVVDLGAAWTDWTGLPFVFATWVGRAGLPLAEADALARTLDRAAEAGLARVDALAREHGPAHGMGEDDARRYLGRTIRYRIGERERAGLDRFASLLWRKGITV